MSVYEVINKYFLYYFDVFVLSIGLIVMLCTASTIKKRDKKIVGAILGYILVLSVFEYIEILCSNKYIDHYNYLRVFASFMCYIIRPAIIVMLFHIKLTGKKKSEVLIWIPAIINFVIYFFALFPNLHWVFWYNDANEFGETFLGYTVYVVCGLYYLGFTISTILDARTDKKKNTILFAMVVFVGIAAFISTNLDSSESIVIDAYVVCIMFYYMFMSYEAAYNDALDHATEMQNKNTALMLSQIQPHFIYNTLATIQVLCDIDPELAAETISDFSAYLRTNMDALDKTKPVPILDEVKHAKCYAKIEKLRFDNIEVEFDIQDEDFFVPVLTIQPMVENAIKYGIRALDNGKVTVRTYKEDDKHYLIIEDNGKGFDVNSIGSDGRNHIGVNNVRSRIENMVHGTYKIESEIGKGTKVTIVIDGEK